MGNSATDLKLHNVETFQFRCQRFPAALSYPIIGGAVALGGRRDRCTVVALLHQRPTR